MFEIVWNHKGYLCGQALAGKVSSNSHEVRCFGRAGAKGTLTHNEPTLAALGWDNGHPGRLGHSLCRENPIKALSSNDHAFQGMLGVSTHWFPLKISQIDCGALYCFTASLQAFSLPTTHLDNFDGRMQDDYCGDLGRRRRRKCLNLMVSTAKILSEKYIVVVGSFCQSTLFLREKRNISNLILSSSCVVFFFFF